MSSLLLDSFFLVISPSCLCSFSRQLVRLLTSLTVFPPSLSLHHHEDLSRNHVCTSSIQMQTVSPQIPASPRVELHLAVPYPTITTHLFQPSVYLHSLTFQRFTEVLPRQNPHYHYFPQPFLLQPLNHLLVLLHNLLRLIHTQIICSNLHNNRLLLVTSLLNLWNHLFNSSSWFTHCF